MHEKESKKPQQEGFEKLIQNSWDRIMYTRRWDQAACTQLSISMQVTTFKIETWAICAADRISVHDAFLSW